MTLAEMFFAASQRVRALPHDMRPDLKDAVFAEHYVNPFSGQPATYARIAVAALIGEMRVRMHGEQEGE